MATTGNDVTGDGSAGNPWATIQYAIGQASSGDTINVAAGTYAESVTINKDDLTITGDAVSRPKITGGLKFDTDLTGLTLENFVVSGNAVLGQNTIVRMYGAITDLNIDNCVFDGEDVTDRNGFSGGQLEGDVTVTGCEFKNILGWALFESRSGSGGDGSAMDTVTFANNHVHDCEGTVVFRGLSTDWTDNVYIYGNTFEDIGDVGVSYHWAAFEVNRAYNVQIYNNIIRNVVEDAWGEGQAMQLWQIGTVKIYCNTITNNYQGIAILKWPAQETYDISGILVCSNSFSGNNQYALSVDDGLLNGPVNARNNWWGATSGPTHASNPSGTGDVVTDNVDFVPWLTAAPPTTVESTDVSGSTKDSFSPAESIYVTGSGYSASTTYNLYVVDDVAAWSYGMTIPSRFPGTETSVTTDASGNIPAGTVAWTSAVLGQYDIVVDVNRNGIYDACLDALDDSDIEVTAGFNVIPEIPLGTAAALITALAALIVYKKRAATKT